MNIKKRVFTIAIVLIFILFTIFCRVYYKMCVELSDIEECYLDEPYKGRRYRIEISKEDTEELISILEHKGNVGFSLMNFIFSERDDNGRKYIFINKYGIQITYSEYRRNDYKTFWGFLIWREKHGENTWIETLKLLKKYRIDPEAEW